MERSDVYMPEALKYYPSVTFIELQHADVLQKYTEASAAPITAADFHVILYSTQTSAQSSFVK
jgi:hypothetical protein